MRPVIHFSKKSPQLDHSFFRRDDAPPTIISVIGGIASGKTVLINSLLRLSWQHNARKKQNEVYAVISGDVIVLEWQVELHPQSLKDDARVLQTATKISDVIIVTPHVPASTIDYAQFFCAFLDPADPLFVFSPCIDIEDINNRAKVALAKRRVHALPLTSSPIFPQKVDQIRELVYSEIARRPKRSLNEYHCMLDQVSLQGDYDTSYEIDGLLESQCWMTLTDIAKLVYKVNIKSKLPLEDEDLKVEIDRCLDGLRSCGRKLILRPSTTFSQDVARELKMEFRDWKRENFTKSEEVCERAFIDYKNQRATNPSLPASSVQLVGPAKKSFVVKLAELDLIQAPLTPKKRKIDSVPDGTFKRAKLVAAGPLKKFILFNNSWLDDSAADVQRVNRSLTPVALFRNRFFTTALGDTPIYRLTKDYFKILVRMAENKSYLEFIEAYQIDRDSGEKIQLDPATIGKIEESIKRSKQRGLSPASALQEVVNAAFGGRTKSITNSMLHSMAIEEDITFSFPMLEVLVENEPRTFNKFTVKGKTRLTVMKHIVAFFKVMTATSNEKRQEIFDSFRVSCNFGNAEMKNEFFEMFFDASEHTTISHEDPTDEELPPRETLEKPMEVSEDKMVTDGPDLPIDFMAEDEALFTMGSFEEEEMEASVPSSQFSLADVIILDDDE